MQLFLLQHNTMHQMISVPQHSLQSGVANLYVDIDMAEFLCKHLPSLLNPKYAFLHISLSYFQANFSAESLDLHDLYSLLPCP